MLALHTLLSPHHRLTRFFSSSIGWAKLAYIILVDNLPTVNDESDDSWDTSIDLLFQLRILTVWYCNIRH